MERSIIKGGEETKSRKVTENAEKVFYHFTFIIIYDNIQKEGDFINHLEFYMEENGTVPVREFLMSLPSKLRAKAFSDIELLEKHGSDLREPHVKAMKGSGNKGLFELRIRFSNDIARIFYFTYYQGTYVLLHGFIKKTMRTPKQELERARRCMEDYKRRMEHEQSRN